MEREILRREYLFYDNLVDFEDIEFVIRLWNCYCDYQGQFKNSNMYEEMIYKNDEEFMNQFTPMEVAEKIHFGDYNYYDSWISYDKEGNFLTYAYSSEILRLLSLHEMIDWYNQPDCPTDWTEIIQ